MPKAKDSEKAQRLREKKERKLFEALVKQSDEKVAEARGVLEQVLKTTGQPNYQKAIGILDAALELHPRNHEAFVLRGNARRDQLLLDEAIDDYTKAIELEPSQARAAYEGRAVCLELQRDYDRAMQDYSQIIADHPENDHAHNMRGAALLKKRPQGLLLKEADFAAAVRDFNDALRLNEHNFHARTNLGKAYSDQRQYPEAIKCFTMALASNEGYRYANYRRACANIALATELQREEDRYNALLATKKRQLAALAEGVSAASASPSPTSPTAAGSGANAAKRKVLLGLRVERAAADDVGSPQEHVALEDKAAKAAADRAACLTSAISDLSKVINKEHKNLEITAVVHLGNCFFELGDDAAAAAEFADALAALPADDAAMSANAAHVQQFMNLNGTMGGTMAGGLNGTMIGGSSTMNGTLSGTMAASMFLSNSQLALGSAMMAAPLSDVPLLRRVIETRLAQINQRKAESVAASLHATHSNMDLQ